MQETSKSSAATITTITSIQHCVFTSSSSCLPPPSMIDPLRSLRLSQNQCRFHPLSPTPLSQRGILELAMFVPCEVEEEMKNRVVADAAAQYNQVTISSSSALCFSHFFFKLPLHSFRSSFPSPSIHFVFFPLLQLVLICSLVLLRPTTPLLLLSPHHPYCRSTPSSLLSLLLSKLLWYWFRFSN